MCRSVLIEIIVTIRRDDQARSSLCTSKARKGSSSYSASIGKVVASVLLLVLSQSVHPITNLLLIKALFATNKTKPSHHCMLQNPSKMTVVHS